MAFRVAVIRSRRVFRISMNLPLRSFPLMCVNPRKILNIAGGNFSEGEPADIAIVDLNEEWTVDPEKLHGKSKNTCFKGMTLKGRVKKTIVDGKIVYEDK